MYDSNIPKSFQSSLSSNNSFADNCKVSGIAVCAFETNTIQSNDNININFFIISF